MKIKFSWVIFQSCWLRWIGFVYLISLFLIFLIKISRIKSKKNIPACAWFIAQTTKQFKVSENMICLWYWNPNVVGYYLFFPMLILTKYYRRQVNHRIHLFINVKKKKIFIYSLISWVFFKGNFFIFINVLR
jgi:hypothetical protein